MDRQTFLGTLVALPVGLFLVNCSSSNASDATPAQSTEPAAAPVRSGTSTTYTCSKASGHFHTAVMDDAALSANVEFRVGTSTDSMHQHLVVVSVDQLAQISAGDSVLVTTSVDDNHTHVFTFLKVS